MEKSTFIAIVETSTAFSLKGSRAEVQSDFEVGLQLGGPTGGMLLVARISEIILNDHFFVANSKTLGHVAAEYFSVVALVSKGPSEEQKRSAGF